MTTHHGELWCHMGTSSAVGVDDNPPRSLAKHAETCRLEFFAEMRYIEKGKKRKVEQRPIKIMSLYQWVYEYIVRTNSNSP